MTYKNKLVFLLSLISVLSLTYIAGIIFSPERSGAKSASYVWLDQKLVNRITRIVINSPEQKIELQKNNDQWFVLHNGREYPARQARIEDFISIFTVRAAWNVRSTNASSQSRFGLDDGATELIIYGENTVLLDLLLGSIDAAGREIYVRRNGVNEIRSGENKITSYLSGSVNAWFNLRLFAESENGKIDVDDVQRLSVYNGGESQIFTRVNRSWDLSVTNAYNPVNPYQGSIESYIKIVLNSEGDSIADDLQGITFNHSRIVMEYGNGKVTTVRFSEPDENDRCFASTGANEYVFSVPAWVMERLFRDAASFETQ